ncbi:MAG: hypothetical protein ACM3MK_03435 [Chitinophagales bacterium]
MNQQQALYGNFISNCYVINVQEDANDGYLEKLQHDILYAANKFNLVGAILDFSNVSLVNSYLFEFFKNLSKTVSLMGLKVIWVGLQPGVVSALIDLNAQIDDIYTAVNVQFAINCINSKEIVC